MTRFKDRSKIMFRLQEFILVIFYVVAALLITAGAHGQQSAPAQAAEERGARVGVTSGTVSATIDVQPSQLEATPVGENWLSYNGDYTGRRYSGLREINTSNVSRLRAQWVFHAPNSSHLEVTPVVVDGVMFLTSANDAYALDAQTGRTIWQ